MIRSNFCKFLRDSFYRCLARGIASSCGIFEGRTNWVALMLLDVPRHGFGRWPLVTTSVAALSPIGVDSARGTLLGHLSRELGELFLYNSRCFMT